MNKRVIWAALTGLMVPYVGTLAWTGTIRGEELRYEQQKEVSGRRRILLDRTGGSYYMDMEEYLPGVIARQVPVEYEPEALKAQAIIARTYICRQMEGAGDEEEIARIHPSLTTPRGLSRRCGDRRIPADTSPFQGIVCVGYQQHSSRGIRPQDR